jgi:hypothetical protein
MCRCWKYLYRGTLSQGDAMRYTKYRLPFSLWGLVFFLYACSSVIPGQEGRIRPEPSLNERQLEATGFIGTEEALRESDIPLITPIPKEALMESWRPRISAYYFLTKICAKTYPFVESWEEDAILTKDQVGEVLGIEILLGGVERILAEEYLSPEIDQYILSAQDHAALLRETTDQLKFKTGGDEVSFQITADCDEIQSQWEGLLDKAMREGLTKTDVENIENGIWEHFLECTGCD